MVIIEEVNNVSGNLHYYLIKMHVQNKGIFCMNVTTNEEIDMAIAAKIGQSELRKQGLTGEFKELIDLQDQNNN